MTIDTNPDFTRYLKESIDDPRLVAVTGSAADVDKILADRGLGDADYVLSGLPFSTLPAGRRRRHRRGDRQGDPARRRLPRLSVQPQGPPTSSRPHFDRIDRGFEWINVPPATLFWAYSGEASD